MKIKKYLSIFLIILIIISFINAKQFNFEELKKRNALEKIKYLIFHLFALIENFTVYLIKITREYNLKEPYDFFFCFIIGCFFRVIYLFLKKIFKRIFNITDNNYVYNEPDNTEKLYEVKKKLYELNKNFNNLNGNDIKNNINDINNININNNDIENKIKLVNDKLIQMEKIMNDLGKSYEEEKNHIKINLETIEECQKFIIHSVKENGKEE